MRNRPAIILLLLALVAVAGFQFLIAVTTDGNPPPPPVAAAPAPQEPAEPVPEFSEDYGGLTAEEYYALQDAEAEMIEELERQGTAIDAEALEALEVTDELLTGDSAAQAPELTAEEQAAQQAVEALFDRQDAQADGDDTETQEEPSE